MVDLAVNYVRDARERPVWQPLSPEARAVLTDKTLPTDGCSLDSVIDQFRDNILPFATGNIHPRFFGWVHGSGLAGGIIAEMCAAAMNANCGGRDHAAIYVEKKVIDWCKEIFAFPSAASGILVTGTSMANLLGLGVARQAQLGSTVRAEGVGRQPNHLTVYTSSEAHDSVTKAVEILGIGSSYLRKISVDGDFRIDVAELRRAIEEDRRAGLQPWCVVGSAGTVNTGAIDDLAQLADICERERLWFHVDGAFGALCMLSDTLRDRLRGIERADSIAFDFHKWAHVQYDCGCLLVRDGELHRSTYVLRPPYLQPVERGLAAGTDWPCDYGPDLSRGFRALKVWFALQEHGTRKIGRLIEQNCWLARQLEEKVSANPGLELLARATLNIVCFRFLVPGATLTATDRFNEELVADLQESGIAAPSTTRINGRIAIRVNITNHRTRLRDLDILLSAVTDLGTRRLQ